MLNIADAPKTSSAAPTATATTLGGDAWVMPNEPTGHAWVGAAPSIRIIDQRRSTLLTRSR